MRYPLSQSQLGIYVTCMNTQEEGNYNLDMLFKLDDDVNTDRLAQALDAVIEAHPYVKSQLVTSDNGDVMFEDHTADKFHTTISEINDIEDVRHHLGENYDLMHDQLFRLEIYKTKTGNYLYTDFHHIIFDGMSYAILREDLSKAYDGKVLEAEPVNGFQIAEEELKVRQSEHYQEAKEWYAREFGGATEVDSMPLADIYDNEEVHYSKAWIKLNIDKSAIDALCEKAGVKESMVFTAAFGYTLSKYSCDDEVLFNTVFHGRFDKQTRRAFTMMVKTLPVYNNMTKTSTVVELLQQTSNQIRNARKYATYSYGDVCTDLGVKSYINFTYQGVLHDFGIELNGIRQQSESLVTNTPGIKFLSMIMIEDGEYYVWCEYQNNKFSEAFINGFWNCYQMILREMFIKEKLADIECCDADTLAQLDSFNNGVTECHSVCDDRNRLFRFATTRGLSRQRSAEGLRFISTKESLPEEETVIDNFRKAAKQYPDNLAGVFGDKKYTYRQLDELTDKIGAYIYDKVKDCNKKASAANKKSNRLTEPIVSILIPRNEYMFILPLAAMKAGCAYQPLDPSYPQERLNFMVNDADAALLIADPELRNIISEYDGDVVLTSELEKIESLGNSYSSLFTLHSSLKANSLFILLYTSGSTGVPKGVMLEHQNLVAFIKWYSRYYDLKPEHNVAAYASFGFDACMMDLYPALTTGATVHIIPEELRLDLIALNDYFEKNNITHSFITTQVGVQFLQNTDNHSLLHLSVGGEKLVSVDPAEHYTFHNGYGPTECTVFSTTLPVLKKEQNIPIGKPVDSLKCYVMDKQLHHLPIGAAGELIIVGKQVGRGYLNRPDKTAEAFFTYNGERAYHSGDIVRYRQDGNIEFVGRKDGQVKIRGFRIELKEVEAVIREFPGISDVTVQAFDDLNGGKYIAAYIVSNDTIDIDALNQYILEQKPPYMVPAVTMQIDKIPLNVNQKVDKKALPAPSQPSRGKVPTASAPLNALEKELYNLVASVVNISPLLASPPALPNREGAEVKALNSNLSTLNSTLSREGAAFGITDILGGIGLTSITSIKLATLIYKKYGVQVNAKTLAKTGTLQNIENEILAKWMEGKELASPPALMASPPALPNREGAKAKALNSNLSTLNSTLSREGAKANAILSFAQQGVYTECVTNAGSVQYNIPQILSFPAGTTTEQLKDALASVFAAHPYISCHFLTNENGEVVQEPITDFKLEIPFTRLTKEEFETQKKDLVRPFDLNKGPLFRFEIFEVENILHLFIDIHHLIADGASLDLFYHQICQALDGETIEKESYDYYQFVNEQVLDSNAEQYFDITIGGVEEVSRLLPDIYSDIQDHKQHTISIPLDVPGLENICHKEGITPASFFLAATAITISRYLCEEDVTMVTISNGRSNLLISDTVGMFVNTLPLALHVGTNDSASTMLQHAASVFAEAIEHETYPFAKVASKYDFALQISYACQLGVIEPLRTLKGEVKMESLELDIAKAPIAIFVNGTVDGSKTLDIDFDSSLYTDTMIQHFAQSLANVAAALAEMDSIGSPTKKNLNEISLTTEKDWAQLDSFNLPFLTDYDHSDTVVSLFRRQVQKHPDKTAAIFGDKRYTYRELDEATDRLAEVIYNKVEKCNSLAETVVSIIIDRNEWVFLLPLAVLKTGCAYEPLDPSYPSERLNYMVQDAKAKLLIGQPQFIGQVSEYTGDVILTTELEEVLKAPADDSPLTIDHSLNPKDLLLMLYTSGSTGKPKGVEIEHHSLVSFAHGISKADFYTEDCVAAAYASFGFDVCMMDTFCTLLNGGTLVIIPESMRLELKQLAEYMESEHVTQIFMTTQVGVQFLQNFPEVKYLRYVGMGGEKLPAVNPEGLSYKILNGYGPTENTCGVSLFPIQHWEPNIPLGKPFPTIKGYILDKAGHRLPPGACGEYCVAGDQPARGYLGLPEKTAQVFVDLKPGIWNLNTSLRMYHTGDVVRYRENGDVEFVGRKDGMVKIRGFRIELKEVEAAIRPFEGIKDITVQAYDYDGGGKYLAAFIVGDDNVDVNADFISKLLDFVKSQKPPYMVPAIVMPIERIPLTVNQKVDKKALPKPQLAAAAFVMPKNKIEKDFCEIFAEVLGQEKVSAASDFFEIGGSSIIALKVVIAAEKRGYTIVYNDVFKYTTAQDMATYLSNNNADVDVNTEATKPTETTSTFDSFYGPSTTEVSPDGFDYKEINALLRGNTIEAFRNGQQQPVGDVLLAGATGYLGIHVLKDLIDNYTGKIYCFVRGKGSVSAERRLKHLLFYYFDHNFKELFVSSGNADARISVIEGDATDPKALDDFHPLPTRKGQEEVLTVINCAACVKHFSKGNEIERINVESVRNLIAWCIKNGARLVHVSTGSVAGSAINNVPPKGFLFNEHMLYIGQWLDNNQYIKSKFMAERFIYDAILHHGLNAKVMRVGNLAPRDKDGEFQINFKTNNYMAGLAAYCALGMVPYSVLDTHTEFSPIDKVARAIMCLASTPKKCVCFMPSNQHRPSMDDVIEILSEVVCPIRMVEDDEFQQAVRNAMSDPAKVDKMRPFMAYAGGQMKDDIRYIDFDDLNVNYTCQVLYRLGFRWPATTDEYIRKFLRTISGFNFFD